jgi:hypothetical protein
MRANEMTFGVELETFIPPNSGIRVGGYHSGHEINVRDPRLTALNGWRAEYDSSIAAASNHEPCEFISPVLCGHDGMRKLVAAVTAIKDVVKAKVNSSCGVHVHVGFPRDPEALKRLTHAVATFEQALFASTGTPRRENGRFCRGIQNEFSPDIRFTPNRYRDSYRSGRLSCNVAGVNDRYHILNLTRMVGTSSQQTVEFRVFSGTVRPEKILAWVRLCLAICERAINGKRALKWESNEKAVIQKSKTKVCGKGFGQVKLMMYKLGWVRGRSFETVDGRRVHKTWGASLDGAEGLPSLKDSKRVIKALARKYDEKLVSGRF